MDHEEIINWLLEGDVSIQFQVKRDLLNEYDPAVQKRIAIEGWGAAFLSQQNKNGHWGLGFYQPKWISTHYTLLDLRNLNISPENEQIQRSIHEILKNEKGKDGGINPSGTIQQSDVCINGMVLNYASYYKAAEKDLKSIVDLILSLKMSDGGFNCRINRSGARHSSMHSSICVLEGITEYEKKGYTYRLDELLNAKHTAIEFLLCHQLFLSDRTGEIIHKDFIKLSYPSRWRYDILRTLDYFQYANFPWDNRMKRALDILLKKRNKNNSWNVQAKHPGKLHFEMEKAGKASRWNTLRALRVLKQYESYI